MPVVAAMMNRERREQIEEIFEAAIDLPLERRDAFLTRSCGADTALRSEVEALLAGHELGDGAVDRHVVELAASLLHPPDAERRIGPYRVLRELGRGGMGVVYLAERNDGQFRRRVAIKLLRASPDADELHRRFLAERQILASLNHPNIAQLLDGGVTDGRLPYLVMEYVDGVPITDYCDRHRLGIEARLRLFQEVCAAVHHAHQNLVIHRDLKPSNILVTESGQVKLLDFGIAKLLNPSLSAVESPVTRTEFRVMTPEYASPEQMRGDSLTTASDVYALGVVLYELLAGHPPYRLTRQAPREVLDLVCEHEPERPSTRVLGTEQVTREDGSSREISPATVSAARDLSVERLRRMLKGDLDAIVMMALRKEPGRRYGSAELLAQDIQRYQEGLPVIAHRGSRAYHLRKFLRRHRIQAAAAGLVALSLLGGVGGALWQAAVADRERQRAEQALRESQEVTGFLLGLFAASDPREASGAELTARELLRRGAERADQLTAEPAVQARMLGVLGTVYQSLGHYDDGQSLLERALALQLAQHGEDHAEVASALAQLAENLRRRGQFDSAQVLLERAAAIEQRLLEPGGAEPGAILHALAVVATQRGDLIGAERRTREALDLRRRVLGGDHPLAISSLAQLSFVLRQRGDLAGAEATLREALQLRQATRQTAPSDLASDLIELADLLQYDSARAGEAEAIFRRALSVQRASAVPDHQNTVTALNGLARLLDSRGARADAEAMLREAVEVRERVYGSEHPTTSAALLHLAAFLRRTGRYDEALALYRRVAEVDRKMLGESHPNHAGTLTALAATLMEAGALAEADSLFDRAMEIRITRLGPNHFLVAKSLRRKAQLQIRRGAFAAADSLLQRALAIALSQTTPEGGTVREIQETMAELHDARGDREQAAHSRRLAGSESAPSKGRLSVPARHH